MTTSPSLPSFCPPEGPAPAQIMIVGEFPGESDLAFRRPFSGSHGHELASLLTQVRVQRASCFLTYALPFPPPGGDIGALIALKTKDATPSHRLLLGKPVLPAVWESLDHLKRQIEMVQPSIIICLGSLPLWMLTGQWGVDKWRGSLLTCHPSLSLNLPYLPKVIPTYSLSRLFIDYSKRHIVVKDLEKAVSHRNYQSVIPRDYHFLLSPTISELRLACSAVLSKLNASPISSGLPLSCDIETASGHITMVGIAWSKTEALVIPFTKRPSLLPYWPSIAEEAEALFLLSQILTHPNSRIIGQNFLYDAQYFLRHFRFLPRFSYDTMLANHTMFSNLPKSLDFLSSIYCPDHLYWKAMHHGETEKDAA
jgi:uracil-DNA glycosylase